MLHVLQTCVTNMCYWMLLGFLTNAVDPIAQSAVTLGGHPQVSEMRTAGTTPKPQNYSSEEKKKLKNSPMAIHPGRQSAV